MNTGTNCTKCARARFCPSYDSRVMYGFCNRFINQGERELSEQSCRTCTSWLFDKVSNHGSVGECFNVDVIARVNERSKNDWQAISIGRFANEGKTCEHWSKR